MLVRQEASCRNMEGTIQRQEAWMLLVGPLSDEAIGCLRSGLQHLITVLALQPQSLQHVSMGQGSVKLSKEGHPQLVVSSNKLVPNKTFLLHNNYVLPPAQSSHAGAAAATGLNALLPAAMVPKTSDHEVQQSSNQQRQLQ